MFVSDNRPLFLVLDRVTLKDKMKGRKDKIR